MGTAVCWAAPVHSFTCRLCILIVPNLQESYPFSFFKKHPIREFDNEEYYIVPPPTKANNIVVGGMWLDTFGVLTIGCASGYKYAWSI